MDLYTHSKVTTTLHNVFVTLMYCWEAEIWNPVGEFQELAISHIYPHSTTSRCNTNYKVNCGYIALHI